MSIDDVARALADGTRRSILRLVRDEERSSGDLAGQFRTMGRPAVSQHLRVLHEAGLVTIRAEGNRRMYRARTEGLTDMWRYLDEMWTDRLARLKIAAEQTEWPQRRRAQLRASKTSKQSGDPAESNRRKPKPPDEGQAVRDQPTALRTIEQRVRIAATPETVWMFWTDPARLCEGWGIRAEVEPRPGGTFRVIMGDDGPVMSGAFVAVEPFTRLVFSFGWEGNPMGDALAPGSTEVEVTLTAVDGDTDVCLVHRELPGTHADMHASGWSLFVGERLGPAIASWPSVAASS